jgi:hypothetical protein
MRSLAFVGFLKIISEHAGSIKDGSPFECILHAAASCHSGFERLLNLTPIVLRLPREPIRLPDDLRPMLDRQASPKRQLVSSIRQVFPEVECVALPKQTGIEEDRDA